MPTKINLSPRQYLGVMVSSTFRDLEKHRAALMDALRKEELFAIGMEDYVVVPGDDEISSSLNMVHKGSAYIGLISHRCGQVILCPNRNPQGYSITRVEFEEAQSLKLPTLIFVMGDKHDVRKGDVEIDPDKIAKLEEFRKAAKAGRIYVVFDSLEEFTLKAIHAVASLRRSIEEEKKSAAKRSRPRKKNSTDKPSKVKAPVPLAADKIPRAPALYAEPDYIGSHKFVGRDVELQVLSDWANKSDPTNLLLFEAIGGNGKSMLTWEWTIPQLPPYDPAKDARYPWEAAVRAAIEKLRAEKEAEK
jgi:hypothetical protein